jgi:hypothetical protein
MPICIVGLVITVRWVLSMLWCVSGFLLVTVKRLLVGEFSSLGGSICDLS